MRVGVIRGDLPGAVTIQDLETVSQFNPPTEPPGQERHIGRPDTTRVGAVLATLGAARQGSAAVTLPLTLNGSNNVLRAKTASAASFVAATIATGSYTTMAALVIAVNAALTTAGIAATVSATTAGVLILKSNTLGVGSYIANDSVANGSTFNTPANFGAGVTSFTMPSAAATITALLPVGGPLDVSAATLLTTLGADPNRSNMADVIAPRFIETDVVIKSFQKGNIAGYRSASYTPDPNRLPALALGAAITVVQDDGVSAFTAALPTVSGAVHNSPNTGDITISGSGLANAEDDQTVVRVTSANGATSVKLFQKVIRTTVSGGTTGAVTATSIVIPASLLAGLGVTGSKVQVQYTSLASALFTAT